MISNLNWADPRLYAAAIADEDNMCFLYSGTDAGNKSYLAWGLAQEITSFAELEKLESDKKYFGYFGYGWRNELEDLPRDKPSHIAFPDIYFASYQNLIEFDHANQFATQIYGKAPAPLASYEPKPIDSAEIKSNMSDAEYLQKVGRIIEHIKAGDIYQANLTRKYFGEFASAPNAYQLFHKLTETNPAAYSAYLKIADKAIISASPEKFLTAQNGSITTSPIKGTMPTHRTAEDLQNSEKDRAENLMIVDLMRNDLSKTCDNVEVTELFKVISHKNYHHLHSTVEAKMQSSLCAVIKGCFPPGSMTGTPKIEAMKLCSELEGIERGVYSGALGWLQGQDCDLSVVIRTLLIDGKKFEFQSGGAIVADSVAQNELNELETKISAIRKLLS